METVMALCKVVVEFALRDVRNHEILSLVEV
jgi:hypothetical protein